MSSSPVLLVLGSGPGIGNAVARAFAQKHFSNIVLVARNSSRLETAKAETLDAAHEAGNKDTQVTTFSTDISDLPALRQTLDAVEKLGPIGCVYFNAARIHACGPLKASVEELEIDFRTTNLALYVTAQWAIPLLQKSSSKKPSLFVTNSHLPEMPIPELLCLSAVKASQQNIVHSLRAVFGSQIHIVGIKVCGQVSVAEPHLNPDKIAEQVVLLYEQGKETWNKDLLLISGP